LAERTFYRRFKQAAGATPIKYLQLARIEKSKTYWKKPIRQLKISHFKLAMKMPEVFDVYLNKK